MAPLGGRQGVAAARTRAAQVSAGAQSPQGNGLMNYIDQVSQATDYMLTHPVSDVANAVSLLAGLVTGNGAASQAAARRMIGWQGQTQIASLKQWALNRFAQQEHQIVSNNNFQLTLTLRTAGALGRQMVTGFRDEANARIRGDNNQGRYTRSQVAALHHLIEREAAGAYRGGYSGRVAVIRRLADYLAAHNPVVSKLVSVLVQGVLDLAVIDDPIARITLSFVIKHIIERLSVDKVAGAALSDLLAPLLGNPRPHDLPGVIRDVSARLGALEGQQGRFWADGGAEVEQAGQQWAAITSPLADAAIIAWLAQGVKEPEAWAREITDVVEPVANGAIDVMTKLMREG